MPVKGSPLTQSERDKIVKLYRQGLDIEAMIARTSRSKATICAIIKSASATAG